MLIGHDKQYRYFKNLIKNNALGHSYLFTGLETIGKRAFASELYGMINGRGIENEPDFKMIALKISEDEHKIYIDDIRLLKSFFSLKPYQGPYKFAIIDNADSLTTEAANALLKLLEEPPSFSVIVLVSSLPSMLPATILSRCEEVKFVPASKEEIKTHLAGFKNIKLDDREFLATLAGGRMGLVDNLIGNNEIPEARKAVDDLRKLIGSGIFEKMDYAKKIHEKGDYQPRINYWLSWVSAHLHNASKNEKIVKDLLLLNSIISQPQFNHRLALENFLLNL